ncbi:pyridoxal phosphate-dependent aminotransferase [Shimazuella sp. AN120528]|uniref:MalY/PatB family protein n=1 Tax=Shimazuella soli TaxID=1892854 RepID=UPI001F0FA05B|nr:MalY/PatB family protein [Shimazuella soli]MCH5586720.1 pyridoxal phosphate-dependent aminotransferase [Shimazuella soli]
MNSNFDEDINRYHTFSEKWDGVEKIYYEPDLLPLWVADMDFRSPLPVREAMAKRIEHGVFGYNIRMESYYNAIVDWMDRKHNWTIQQEWICYSPGVMPAISLIINDFTQPGDHILVQPPVYAPLSEVVIKNNRKLVENPLKYENNRYTIDFIDLEKKLAQGIKVLILCSPQNPVGRVWGEEELTILAQKCIERDVLIISDEIHSDLIYQGNKHIPLASLSEEIAQRSIVCNAPTKTFNLPGVQTANIIIPNEKLRKLYKSALNRHFLQFSNTFGVIATESAYRYGADWLNECMAYVEKNLSLVDSYLKEHVPEMKVVQPEGTYLAWIDCQELKFDTPTLMKCMLKKAKVAPVFGKTFGSEGEGFLRLNLAAPRSLIQRGLQQMSTAIHEYRAARKNV